MYYFYISSNRAFYYENISKHNNNNNNNKTIQDHPFNLNPTSLSNIDAFVIIIFIAVAGSFVRALGVVGALLKCSRRLHDKMFNGVLMAPLYFFNTHSSGIANLFIF